MHSVVTGDKKKSGIIRKYGLNMSRQAFREHAKEIGFIKVCDSGKRVWGTGADCFVSTDELGRLRRQNKMITDFAVRKNVERMESK